MIWPVHQGPGLDRDSGRHCGARSSEVQHSGCRGAGLAAGLTRILGVFPGVTNHDNILCPCQPITDFGALFLSSTLYLAGPVDKTVPLLAIRNLPSLRASTMTL